MSTDDFDVPPATQRTPHPHDHAGGQPRAHEHGHHDHGHHDHSHHDHGHAHDHEHLTWKHLVFTVLIGVLLVLRWRGIVTTWQGIDVAIVLTLVGGFPVFYEAIQGLFEKRILAELAVTIAAVAALAVQEYVTAAVVVFIMLVGHALEDYAAGRARKSIRSLIELAPETACVRRDGVEVEVPLDQVQLGETVVVRPGERIPVDGLVLSGVSGVNQAFITGESLPVSKQPGDEVFGGTLNGEGALEVEVRRVGEDTTLATVVRLVEEAQHQRAPVQRLADRYATYFVPAVLLIALGTFLLTGKLPMQERILRAVTVLVVTCPCALVLATPTAVICALARLAREGVLVKGGAFLERLAETTCMVFDKTGTLTQGTPSVAAIHCFGDADESTVLSLAAAAEARSEHVLARLTVEYARQCGVEPAAAVETTAHPGQGVECVVEGSRVLVGNASLLETQGVVLTDEVLATVRRAGDAGQTVALVASGKHVVGCLCYADSLRPEAPEVIHQLGHVGVQRVVMLTGDTRGAASTIAQAAGLREVEAELLPAQKVERVKALQAAGHTVAMLGDGVNDAPSLAAAQVGIAMGGTGIDLTLEAADIVLMTDDLSRLPRMLAFSQRTVALIKQNMVVFALGVNAAAIIAAALGKISPITGAVIHEVSSLLVVLNSMRLLVAGRLSEGRVGRALAAASRFYAGVTQPVRALTVDAVRQTWDRVREPVLRWARVVVPTAYLVFSSVYLVGPDQLGVIRRFGRVVADHVPAGLHVHWPYPIERLTRLESDRIRVAEIGYRTDAKSLSAAASEPAAYEWNTQHRGGRFKKVPEESLMFTGDEIMVEVNAVCQYSVRRQGTRDYLFRAADIAGLVRRAAESALRDTVRHTAFEALLTTERQAVERHATQHLQTILDSYDCGLRVHSFYLQDVHPPIEVVDAYRDVASALEEKATMINEAEAYRNEQLPLARGKAAGELVGAAAFKLGRVNRADGDAARFTNFAQAYHVNPQVTGIRLHLESVEESLAGKRKLILDRHRAGRRQLYLLESNGLKVSVPGIDKLGATPGYAPYNQPE